MVITKAKPYGIIKSQLKKSDRIELVSCNACVKFCKTGGEEKMQEMAQRLRKDGFNVVDTDLIGMACVLDLVKKQSFKGNVLIAFTCDAGIFNIEKLAKGKKIIAALDTVGIGTRDGEKNISLVKKF